MEKLWCKRNIFGGIRTPNPMEKKSNRLSKNWQILTLYVSLLENYISANYFNFISLDKSYSRKINYIHIYIRIMNPHTSCMWLAAYKLLKSKIWVFFSRHICVHGCRPNITTRYLWVSVCIFFFSFFPSLTPKRPF